MPPSGKLTPADAARLAEQTAALRQANLGAGTEAVIRELQGIQNQIATLRRDVVTVQDRRFRENVAWGVVRGMFYWLLIWICISAIFFGTLFLLSVLGVAVGSFFGGRPR